MKLRTIEIPISTLKEYAKEYAKELNTKHTQALNKIAQNFGYSKFEVMKSKVDSSGYLTIIVPDRIKPFYKMIHDEEELKTNENLRDILCVATSIAELYENEKNKIRVDDGLKQTSIYLLDKLNKLINISSEYYERLGNSERSTPSKNFHFILNDFLKSDNVKKSRMLEKMDNYKKVLKEYGTDNFHANAVRLPENYLNDLKVSLNHLKGDTNFIKVELYNRIVLEYFKKNLRELNFYNDFNDKEDYIEFLNKFN